MSQLETEVLMTTSSDPRFSGSNMVDGNVATFWTTTGMFPQEVLLGFQGSTVTLTRLKLWCHGVRKLVVQVSCETHPVKFKAALSMELAEKPTSTNIQTETFQINNTVGSDVRFVKLILQSGWEDFASIHSVVLEGDVQKEAPRPELPPSGQGPPATLQSLGAIPERGNGGGGDSS
eukprot:Rhum_TRINITY_DN2971_c0_g1::Rhum_TRINITY_DN2971_c0_g1_i1::g.8916::m.8916/K19369/HSPB11; heat shock protein beta-11